MPMIKFLLDHGVEYRHGPGSFTGRRAEPKACFQNATLLMLEQPDLTYVEGKVSVYGLPIDHAWCVDQNGLVIDPTLVGDSDLSRLGGYFGIPFERDYVLKACKTNKVYGLLDGFYARKTLPKLVELGLAEGQAWLLSGKRRLKAGVAALICAAALLAAPDPVSAQSRVVYGPDGRPVTQIHSDYARGTATEYDAKTGRVTGRATTGSDGTITVYGEDGRVRERIAPGSGRKP
jgi:hypothetical protein